MPNQISRSARETAAAGPKPDRWDDDDEFGKPASRPLTYAEARALVANDPPLSPWRVVAAQVLIGTAAAALAWWWTKEQVAFVSALYGAGAVVLPAALMAYGMTGRLANLTPGASFMRVMVWEFVKVAVTVAMLVLAPKLVPGLSWPAMLGTLALCISVYWFALAWRGRAKRQSN